MANICTNPHVYQGDPGNPPEFISDNPIECSVCRVEFDADEYEFRWHTVNGKGVCGDCIETCDHCGQWLDDEAFPKVVTIRFREWFNNGKLSLPHCPQCAGNFMISQLAALPVTDFNYEDFTDFEIASMLMPISASMRKAGV